MLVVFTVVGIDYSNPLSDWIALLEKGETELVRNSWREVKDTQGMMPDYFFIRTMNEAYDAGKCSDEVISLARSIYSPMAADF